MTEIFTPDTLIILAAGTYVLGYLVINQVVLRALILAGTVFYILYYATVAETPLWGAIYTSLAILIANLIGVSLLLMQRARWIIPAQYRALYEDFTHLQPGDFRHVVRMARHKTLTELTELTKQDAAVENVYLILSGRTDIEKMGEAFEMPAGVFVGEVAYLLHRNASATTRVHAGGELLVWPIDALRRKSARNPRFKLALEAMISRDLARKVAFAVAPADRRRTVSPDPILSDISEARQSEPTEIRTESPETQKSPV